MKKFVLIFVLLFVLVPYLNAEEKNMTEQLDFQIRWLQYESQKKSVGLGIICSLVVPGGGMFYAGESGMGIFYLGVEIGLASWYIHELTKPLIEYTEHKETNIHRELLIPSFLLLSVRIIEFFDVNSSIRDYNSNLLKRLNLLPQIGFENDKMNIGLVYKF